MWIFILISLCCVYLLCYKVFKIYGYWFDKGIRTVSPIYWFRIYNANVIRANSSSTFIRSIYKKYRSERYIGLYQLLQPILLIFDPELIKQILIKDFNAFPVHNDFISDPDPLWGTNVFAISDKEKWRDLRAIMTSFFTISKIRSMFPLMQECSNQFLTYLKTKDDVFTIEIRNLCSRYANDVISRTAFSVSCDSLNEIDEFYSMVQAANEFSVFTGLKYIGYLISPMFMKLVDVKMIKDKPKNFFTGFVKESLQTRIKNQAVRPDLIQLLIDSRNASGKYNDGSVTKHNLKLTDDDIIAQCLAFGFAGVETVNTTLSYVFYELAQNQYAQEKLCIEIQEALMNCNGTITHDVLISMKYLDNVISESLRLHPPSFMHDRKCVKSYTIENNVRIEKNVWIWIPFGAMQRDERYFPNAEQFDPDRFNDENKHNINPLTYIPFGLGPRSCIGLKFGMLEIKLLIVEVLRRYQLVPIENIKTATNPKIYNSNEEYPSKIWIGLKLKL